MQRITWYALLAVVAFVAPIGGQAQAAAPKVREIATLPGIDVREAIRMPNGRVVLYRIAGADSIFAYDLASKRSSLVTRGSYGEMAISPAGDRISYDHLTTDPNLTIRHIWSIPINSQTGAATGPAQRVSMREGVESTFSPDGKLIAFEAHERQSPPTRDYRHLLAVVPATGGPERILAEYDNITDTCWSGDGKWIYVLLGNRDRIERVPVAGGTAEKVTAGGRVGGAIEGHCTFYGSLSTNAQATGSRAKYAATSGSSGEFEIPLGSHPGNHADVSGLSLLRKATRPATAHVLNLADGKIRNLIPGTSRSLAQDWSPDGRRLAVQTGTSERLEITVMNADGSGTRRYPVNQYPTAHVRWSPDGKRLAFHTESRRATLTVLELETGAVRAVSSGLPNGFITDFMWRSDSRSLLVVKFGRIPGQPREVFEANVDGKETKLRDIGPEFGAGFGTRFVSEERILFGNGMPDERYLVGTRSGTPQKLPGGVGRRLNPGLSSDGKWTLWFVQDADNRMRALELMATSGESVRTLTLPFDLPLDARQFSALFHPDGKHAIVVGKTPGDTVSKIFLVPLNGDAPRVLAQFPRLIDRGFLSPEGRQLVFTSEGEPTSTLYELDVRPLLKSVVKR